MHNIILHDACKYILYTAADAAAGWKLNWTLLAPREVVITILLLGKITTRDATNLGSRGLTGWRKNSRRTTRDAQIYRELRRRVRGFAVSLFRQRRTAKAKGRKGETERRNYRILIDEKESFWYDSSSTITVINYAVLTCSCAANPRLNNGRPRLRWRNAVAGCWNLGTTLAHRAIRNTGGYICSTYIVESSVP